MTATNVLVAESPVLEFWQRDRVALLAIKQNGFSAYLKSLPNHESAFNLKDTSLRCIDEGTPGGVHLAGSGILLDVDKVQEYLKDAHVDGVYSHAQCGAAALYAKQENLDPAFADEYGQEWAKTMAEKLKVPYKGHLEINQMQRPSGLHIARIAYYDLTGSFDFSAVAGLPAGFIINRKFLEVDYAKKELAVALSIAFGHHGFGQLFTEAEPFMIVILRKEGDSLSDDINFAAEVGGLTQEYGARIIVEEVSAA